MKLTRRGMFGRLLEGTLAAVGVKVLPQEEPKQKSWCHCNHHDDFPCVCWCHEDQIDSPSAEGEEVYKLIKEQQDQAALTMSEILAREVFK